MPATPTAVVGDPAKLHDALRNLLENATNYAPESSRIIMGAERIGQRIRLTVADEGPGIPEADLPRIFERFYRVDKSRTRGTRDPGGTGLGLAIVKHLIELHGGKASAANRPDGGAVFTIEVPSPVADRLIAGSRLKALARGSGKIFEQVVEGLAKARAKSLEPAGR